MTFSIFVLTSIKDISNKNRPVFKTLTIFYVNVWHSVDIAEESVKILVSYSKYVTKIKE